MIDLIQELVQFLSEDLLSVNDVVGKVGHVTNVPGGLMPIELQPTLPGVCSASVSRDPDTGLPYLLTIEPTAKTRLTPTNLQKAFGRYKRLRTERGRPPEIIFYPAQSESQWRVAIIAILDSTSEPLEDQQISSLTFRRDRSS